MNFSLDGLVLYVPLWHPELSGSSFLSKDLNAHVCTVTGATWGLQGRACDGDDYIDCGSNASLNTGITNKLTMEVWVYANRQTKSYPETGTSVLTRSYQIELFRPNALPTPTSYTLGVTFGMGDAWQGNNLQVFAPSYTPAEVEDKWHHVVVTFDRPNVKIYKDGQVILSQTWDYNFATNAGDNLFIGKGPQGANSCFNGTFGEFRIYNRALSLTEVTHNRNTTRWRYA
jgi:hypothetical protein